MRLRRVHDFRRTAGPISIRRPGARIVGGLLMMIVGLCGCSSPPRPGVQVTQSRAVPGSFDLPGERVGIVSTSAPPLLHIQWPLRRREALRGASDEAEHVLEGVMTYASFLWPAAFLTTPYVSARAAGAAVAGVSDEEFRTAWEAHGTLASEILVHESLRQAVSQAAHSRGWSNWFPVPKPRPPGDQTQFNRMAYFLAATLAWLPRGTNVVEYLTAQGARYVLEIEVSGVALAGKPGVHPPLALSYRVEARLLEDAGRRISGVLSLAYRSERRRFEEWMEPDATPFRRELQSSCRQCADIILDWCAGITGAGGSGRDGPSS